MANSVSVNQSVTSNVDGVRTTVSSNQTTFTTSSNFIAGSQNVTSSAWTAVSLGTLSDVLILTVQNDNASFTGSVIALATGSNGQNLIGYLNPGGQQTTYWSGSLTGLYAKVVAGYPQGTSTPTQGTVQWLTAQS